MRHIARSLEAPEMVKDGGDIVVAYLRDFIASLANLFDNRVRNHGSSSHLSSSGVQITGGRNPSRLQTVSITSRTAAFVMCAQFHVNRKFIP
jgi:hypothetical protein